MGSEPRLKKEALYAELGYLQEKYERYPDKRRSQAVSTRKEMEKVQRQLDQIEDTNDRR